MERITGLGNWADDRGNSVTYHGKSKRAVNIRFDGSDNRVVIANDALIDHLRIAFVGDGGSVELAGGQTDKRRLRFTLRVGHGSSVRVGEQVSCQSPTFVSAAEGADVTVGDDVMLAADVQLRTDDTHAIFHIADGARANMSEPIDIGAHVWIAKDVIVLGGVRIGQGSVVGIRSVVTRSVPNNSVVAGSPARVVRKDIAWEWPVTYTNPVGQTHIPDTQRTDAYWNPTADLPPGSRPQVTAPFVEVGDESHPARTSVGQPGKKAAAAPEVEKKPIEKRPVGGPRPMVRRAAALAVRWKQRARRPSSTLQGRDLGELAAEERRESQ